VTCGEAARRSKDCPPADKAATWDAAHSYGMLLGKSLNSMVHLISYGGKGLIRDWQGRRDVLNAPQFFELALAEDSAPKWAHETYVPDAIFISLGTNDFSRSAGTMPETAQYVTAYLSLLKRITALYPATKIFLTEGAILNGAEKAMLRRYIEETVAAFANPKVLYLPSVCYPGDPCNAHPTGEQHQQMAKDFEPLIRTALGW
jgi:hypothetical protein